MGCDSHFHIYIFVVKYQKNVHFVGARQALVTGVICILMPTFSMEIRYRYLILFISIILSNDSPGALPIGSRVKGSMNSVMSVSSTLGRASLEGAFANNFHAFRGIP